MTIIYYSRPPSNRGWVIININSIIGTVASCTMPPDNQHGDPDVCTSWTIRKMGTYATWIVDNKIKFITKGE